VREREREGSLRGFHSLVCLGPFAFLPWHTPGIPVSLHVPPRMYSLVSF